MHWKCIRKTLRREILDYLHSLPLRYDIEVNGQKYLLAHASVAEEFDGNPPYLNPIHYAVWKRLEQQDQLPGARTVIFGHTPTKYYRSADPLQIYYGEGRIGIDCGSGFPDRPEDSHELQGRLACLRLDDMQEFYSEEVTE
jgi:serine/threonine protein phosphatase 1